MSNSLKHLAEFQQLLDSYQIPVDNPVLSSVRLVLFYGATATGRDSIIAELVKTGDYYHLVSNTTRQPRVNNGVPEQSGVEYWFRTEEEMLNDLQAGKMLEAEIIHEQQVSGISLAELERAVQLDKIAITNVEHNIINIIKAKPDATAIMVLPPSFDEGLRRLKSRGDVDPSELHRRVATAKKVYQFGIDWNKFHYIVNDTLDSAVRQVRAIVGNNIPPSDTKEHRDLAEQLLADTIKWLSENPS